jgi:hypothetical protein
MLTFFACLALLLTLIAMPACVSSAPPGAPAPSLQWQCLDEENAAQAQALSLAPFPLLFQAAGASSNGEARYGAAAAAIQIYQQRWLSILPSQLRNNGPEDWQGLPAEQRLNRIKGLLSSDIFGSTEQLLLPALASTPQLSAAQKHRLESVLLQQQHMQLLFAAARAREEFQYKRMSALDCLAAARRLRQARETLARTQPGTLAALRADEKAAADWAAENWAAFFVEAEPLAPLPAVWLQVFDPAELGQEQDWSQRLIGDWRKADGRPLHWGQSSENADGATSKQASWLIQTMPLPEKHDRINAYINFLALPGSCTLFFNGEKIGQKDSAEAESCRFPLRPFAAQQDEQTIACYFPNGCPVPYPFPVWISSEPAKKDRTP